MKLRKLEGVPTLHVFALSGLVVEKYFEFHETVERSMCVLATGQAFWDVWIYFKLFLSPMFCATRYPKRTILIFKLSCDDIRQLIKPSGWGVFFCRNARETAGRF